MKKYLLLLLLLLACIHSQAQTTDSTKTKKISKQFTKEAEPERMTWEVATNVYPWIFREIGGVVQPGNPSIFLRKNITKLKGLNEVYRAYRFRISLNSTFRSLDTLSNYIYATRGTVLRPSIEVGYEYQQQMGKFQLFYGSDIVAEYYLSKAEIPAPNNRNNVVEVHYTKTQGYNVGVAPFIGIKYFIHSHFAVSLESNFLVYFSSYDLSEKNVYNGQILYESNSKTTSFNTSISSVSVLNVSYLF
jgi:hypothetical protein